jgi:hypothetical protein
MEHGLKGVDDMGLRELVETFYEAEDGECCGDAAEAALLRLLCGVGDLCQAYRLGRDGFGMEIGVARVLHAGVDLGLAAGEVLGRRVGEDE